MLVPFEVLCPSFRPPICFILIQTMGFAHLGGCIQLQWYCIHEPVFYLSNGKRGQFYTIIPDLLAGSFQGLLMALF